MMHKVLLKNVLTLLFLLVIIDKAFTQTKTENIIVVTLDGMRWQEVFNGADAALLKNHNYTKDSLNTHKLFWNDTLDIRRKKLFPFLWTVIEQQGQIYGNRNYGNFVNVSNPYKFSYPGYNEIFTGYPDTAVNSNDKRLNKNVNVLEFINAQPKYHGRVAAFSTWDAFPFILNKFRNGIYVNSDVDSLPFQNPTLSVLNDMQFLTAKPIDARPDIITYMAAREYWKIYQPKILYIAFDETDDFAHAGEYDQYLKSANAEDKMIADLWNLIQQNERYKNKTTLIITCDHGRGDADKNNWKHHGEKIAEADQIWLAVIGPDSPHKGEVKVKDQIYQQQIAATMAALIGLKFETDHPVAHLISSIMHE